MDLLQDLMGTYNFDKVTLVEGGTTRHRSIHAAVRALKQGTLYSLLYNHEPVQKMLHACIRYMPTITALQYLFQKGIKINKLSVLEMLSLSLKVLKLFKLLNKSK